jgi:RNA polymerase sigma-70 factor (ECF subfamily)
MYQVGQDALATEEMIARAAAGDGSAWQQLACAYRYRLRRMIALRLDPRLCGRVDPFDLVQETFLYAIGLLPDYRRDPPLAFYLWLRQLAGTRLAKAHRRHLGSFCRDIRREVPLLEVSSAALANHLVDREIPPSEAKAELRSRLEELLDQLGLLNREILALRHFEQLNNGEAAHVLGLTQAAAGKRYTRALERLRERLPCGLGRRDL